MSGEDSGSQDFNWDLHSSTVRAGGKLPIPEKFRSKVCIDSSGSPATWWGYDTESGYAFLSSNYTSNERYITVNNQSYKLEKGSRVTVPKPESSSVKKGILGEVRPEKGDTVYFYSDSRMWRSEPRSTIVLSKDQLEKAFEQYIHITKLAERTQNSSVLNADLNGPVENRHEDGGLDVSNHADKILKESFPVPQ